MLAPNDRQRRAHPGCRDDRQGAASRARSRLPSDSRFNWGSGAANPRGCCRVVEAIRGGDPHPPLGDVHPCWFVVRDRGFSPLMIGLIARRRPAPRPTPRTRRPSPAKDYETATACPAPSISWLLPSAGICPPPREPQPAPPALPHAAAKVDKAEAATVLSPRHGFAGARAALSCARVLQALPPRPPPAILTLA